MTGGASAASRAAPSLLSPWRVDCLEAFVVVAREGQLTRAAEVLHITQSGLTRRIQALETMLGGAALFGRSTRPMKLTPLGGRLLPYATRIVAEAQAFERVRARAPRRG